MALCLVGLLVSTSCNRQPTETLADLVRETESGERAQAVLDDYFPKSPPKPAKLQLAKGIRILAPLGWLDHYDQVDLRRDRISKNTTIYARNEQGDYVAIAAAEAKTLDRTRQFFVYRLAPALERFEKDYGIEIAVEHFTNDELQFDGINADRAKGFDLVFGPRCVLPVFLDKSNLAPFDEGALTRFAQPMLYITELIGRAPPDLDLAFCVPYYWLPLGIGYNPDVAVGIPREWRDGFVFERNELYWNRVELRRNAFIMLGLAMLYEEDLQRDDPNQYAKDRDATQHLLADFTAIVADPSAAANKASALEALRRKFTAPPEEVTEDKQFGIHTATFRSATEAKFEAEHLRSFMLEGSARKNPISNEALAAATDLVKKMLMFGAEFVDERPSHLVEQTNLDWAYQIGSSGDPYAGMRSRPDFFLSIPAPKAPLELGLFILPVGRSDLNRRTAEFFVDYLLIPEVAASMTAFSLKANFVHESIAYMPVEIVDSSIYTAPDRYQVTYLPIASGVGDQFRQAWQDVLQFSQTVKKIDNDTGAARRGAGYSSSLRGRK